MKKITITLEPSILLFVDEIAQGNRSSYINSVLAQHRRQILEEEMIAALAEDVTSAEYQAEIAEWDTVVGDGIDAEG